MSGYFDRAIEALQFCAELDDATIDVIGDKGEVIKKYPQGRDDEVKMLLAAIRVLEAAGKFQESRTTEAMWDLWQSALPDPDQAKKKP